MYKLAASAISRPNQVKKTLKNIKKIAVLKTSLQSFSYYYLNKGLNKK